jgi:sigma-B regulation protein RsbU (phosphoserine phosphatase)
MRSFLLLAAAIVQLSDGWQYARTPPRPTPPVDATWREEVEAAPGSDLWYRITLPSPLPPEPRFVARSYAASFEIFAGDRRVYTFREDAARDRLRLHVVPLPAHAAGKPLYVHVPAGQHLPVLGSIPLIAGNADVPRALVRMTTESLHAELDDVIAGAILIVVGLGSIVISRIRRSTTSGALLWFGVFASLYGIRLILSSYILLLLGASTRQVAYLESWITFVIAIPGWTVARKLLGDGPGQIMRWQIGAFALFALIGIAAGLITGDPNALEWANNILVILGFVTIVVTLVHARRKLTRDLQVVMAGSVVFMLFALLNNAASLGVLPVESVDETLGFLAFVGALQYAAARTFLRGERERVALEGELATARDIQRSILPTGTPQVGSLRFATRYEPASSVAGDFYDYVAADATHVGVVVADVAGHGVPAALIASMVKVAVSSHARLADDPAALLRELNTTLRRDVRRNFVTATYLWFDMEQRTLSVSNAGHAPPVLIRGDAVRDLGPHGVLLGRFAIAAYEAETVALQPGDRIAAWTDGLVEARNVRDEQFGEERLRAMLREGATADAIVEAVLAWRTGEADDLTIVIVDV